MTIERTVSDRVAQLKDYLSDEWSDQPELDVIVRKVRDLEDQLWTKKALLEVHIQAALKGRKRVQSVRAFCVWWQSQKDMEGPDQAKMRGMRSMAEIVINMLDEKES